MSKCAVAIFVKTPGYSPYKTRLAKDLGTEVTEKVYRLLISIAGETAQKAVSLDSKIVPFWAVAENEAVVESLWSNFEVIGQGEGDLGTRMFRVYDELRKRFGACILIGADSPQLEPLALVEVCRWLNNSSSSEFVIGPAEDGGFYLLAGRVVIKQSIWESVTYSLSSTCNDFSQRLLEVGKVHYLSQLTDLDTVEDIHSIALALSRLNDLSGLQKELLSLLNLRTKL